MKFRKYAPALFLLALFTVACQNDDDSSSVEPPRDETEVYKENIQEIESFLATHTYHVETDTANIQFKNIVFDTIAGEHANATPLIDDPALKSKTVKPGDVAYTLYYLEIRKGNEESYQPTFADKVVVSYAAKNMQGEAFEESQLPTVFDFPTTTANFIRKGTIQAITEFKGASGFTENPDGTISYNDDYGIGAVFIPSGLGYFQYSPDYSVLSTYKPYIATFQLYNAEQMDHDGDGIPSFMEDLNGNNYLDDDDTDSDAVANYLDNDDDGDSFPTRDEIVIHEPQNGYYTEEDIELTDSNNDGTPDYLDPTI